MKKLFLTLILSMLCVAGYAQHLQFLGIPLDGDLDTFVEKLTEKGFTLHPESKDFVPGKTTLIGILNGDAVVLVVNATPKSNTVNGLGFVTITDNPDNIMNKYKDLLAHEYNTEPVWNDEEEEFVFKNEQGTIYLSKDSSNVDITFIDHINATLDDGEE